MQKCATRDYPRVMSSRAPLLQLWMGTHPSCPSTLLESKESLKTYIEAHPELLGDKVVQYYGKDLPFLFKVSVGAVFDSKRADPSSSALQVLAIRKALSIQAHPDKDLAKRLHSEKPDVYKGRLAAHEDLHLPNLTALLASLRSQPQA